MIVRLSHGMGWGTVIQLPLSYPDIDQVAESISCITKDRLCDSPKTSRKSGQLCVEACNKTRHKINASKLWLSNEFWDKEDRGAQSPIRVLRQVMLHRMEYAAWWPVAGGASPRGRDPRVVAATTTGAPNTSEGVGGHLTSLS